MDPHLPNKKPKLELDDEPTATATNGGDGGGGGGGDEEQEEALLALIAHRTYEVDHNKQRVSYYKSQLEISERRLKESQSQLARLRSRRSVAKISTSTSHGVANGGPSLALPQVAARPQLNIPAVNPKTSNVTQSLTRSVVGKASPSVAEKMQREPSMGASPPEKKRAKRNFEQREHQDLIPSIQSSSSLSRLCFQSSTHISSQHKRKLRSLVLSPVNDQIFITRNLRKAEEKKGILQIWNFQKQCYCTVANFKDNLLQTTLSIPICEHINIFAFALD